MMLQQTGRIRSPVQKISQKPREAVSGYDVTARQTFYLILNKEFDYSK